MNRPRMYKHRLQKWGLDKKYKEKEVIQMSLLVNNLQDPRQETQLVYANLLMGYND